MQLKLLVEGSRIGQSRSLVFYKKKGRDDWVPHVWVLICILSILRSWLWLLPPQESIFFNRKTDCRIHKQLPFSSITTILISFNIGLYVCVVVERDFHWGIVGEDGEKNRGIQFIMFDSSLMEEDKNGVGTNLWHIIFQFLLRTDFIKLKFKNY